MEASPAEFVGYYNTRRFMRASATSRYLLSAVSHSHSQGGKPSSTKASNNNNNDLITGDDGDVRSDVGIE
jgi:hypothetical protein